MRGMIRPKRKKIVLGGVLACLLTACGDAPEAPSPAAATGAAATSSRPPAPGLAPAAGWFRLARDTGIDFVHDAGLDGSYYMPEVVGGGAALLDLDGDGDLDAYFTSGGHHPPAEGGRGRTPVGEPAANRLFLQDGKGRFIDATDGSGLAHTGYDMGVAAGDIDRDGDPDLLVTSLGRDRLYRNEGNGRFTDITEAALPGDESWSTSAAFLDHDGDGHLDLYIVRYLKYTPPKACHDTSGRADYCGPKNFPAIPDRLLRNRGDGTFEDVSRPSDIGSIAGRGLGVFPADFNGDGWTDIYVANDGMENHFWINRGDGTFREQAMVMGNAVNMDGKAEASMGVAVGDVDGDDDLDLFLTHLDRETNTFYSSIEGRWFEDRTSGAGLAADSLPYTGFGTEFLDVDADGDLDLAVVNGKVHRGAARTPAPPGPEAFRADYGEPNLLFVNTGGGRFRNAPAEAGDLAGNDVSRGIIPGDVDGDGDLDLLVTAVHGPARVLLNEHPAPGNGVFVQARQGSPPRDAIGARIRIESAGRTQTALITSTGSYLTAREPVAHFGLGNGKRYDALQVVWPSGETEVFPGGPAGKVTVVQGEGRLLPAAAN